MEFDYDQLLIVTLLSMLLMLSLLAGLPPDMLLGLLGLVVGLLLCILMS